MFFAQTLHTKEAVAWHAVQTLQILGTRQVFEQAAQWCRSENPAMRTRGADVLGQLGVCSESSKKPFSDESYAILADRVQCETQVKPLGACITALGHLENPAAIALIVPFAAHEHAEVRLEVACALGHFPNAAASIASLLPLMQDVDAAVRDWATFGLGVQGDGDSAVIREALAARLADANQAVREEAMLGLAKRQDRRVLDAVFSALGGSPLCDRIIEAACFLLGIESTPTSWNAADYTKALQEKYAV